MPIWIQLVCQLFEKGAILQLQGRLYFQQLHHPSARSHLGFRWLSSSDLKLELSNCELKVSKLIIIFKLSIYGNSKAKDIARSKERSTNKKYCQITNAPYFVSDKKLEKFLPKEEYFGQALYMFDIGQNDLAGAFYSKSMDEILASIPTILVEFQNGLKVSFINHLLNK